jgi:hypothetical protein
LRRFYQAKKAIAGGAGAWEVSVSKASNIGSRHDTATVALTYFSEKVNIFPNFDFPDRTPLAGAA